jgi:hypothetical protein
VSGLIVLEFMDLEIATEGAPSSDILTAVLE